MNNNVKISTVIPIYNCEKYLQDCLDSILAQTYPSWIAYCIDDGSTDKSSEIIEQYAKMDNRIKAYHKSNGGAHSARNYALNLISADINNWIAFVDSDDYISPFMFEKLVQIIGLVDVNLCQYFRLYKKDTDKNIKDNNEYQKLLIKSKGLYNINKNELQFSIMTSEEYFAQKNVGGMISSLFINSLLIKKNRIQFPEDMRIMEDQVFSITCALKSFKIVEYIYPNYFCRYVVSSLTHTKMDNSHDIIKCINYVKRAFEDVLKSEQKRYYFENIFLPQKINALLLSIYRNPNKDIIKYLNNDIQILKYIKGIKTLMLYCYLKFRGDLT